MYELYPYFTNDGSVGLYSPTDDDIYHSTYGALSEAYEKFIYPAEFDNYFKTNNKIKILDICFGIGYNSKAFLNHFFNFFEKSFNNTNTCIDKIDTNNKFYNIYIKALDTDKNLIYLSPFIKTSGKIFFNNKINFTHEKISKLLSKKIKSKYKIEKFVKIVFLKKIIKSCPEIFEEDEFNKLLNSRKYSKYFDNDLKAIYDYYKLRGRVNSLYGRLKLFLHNIYYKNLSKSYKKASKALKLNEICIDTKIGDARITLKEDTHKYNYIFLDAFAPAKCPSLWTLDFFKELNKHLDDNGMLLTYSNSAAIRNAFIQAGFWVGKIYNKEQDKYIGTIATKKLELIKNGLSEYDLGLINTKAGIVYRDEKLKLNNGAIIAAHDKEVALSELQSSSKFIKNYRGVKNV